LRDFLNSGSDVLDLISTGRLFHIFGAAMEKVLSAAE
jgi:hypothetical protein